MFCRVIALASLLWVLTASAVAQIHPKHEFRGVWIASVANIDWPSKKNLSVEQQKAEFRRIAQSHRQRGLNALVVQIRPAADALYPSPHEPWSEWLTGEQGRPPSPYYDPLEFMIAETHGLGMEFHAWINPFRAVANTAEQKMAPNHVSVTHPEWMVAYGTKKLINPGVPEARDYIVHVIMDIVERYDVDGIHFDDYFYPYPEPNRRFNDDEAFRLHEGGFTDRGDWRRDNINQFIRTLSTQIESRKPWVSFGISPFGVWRNKSKDPSGSDTRASIGTYDDLYADILLWLREGWIDYVAPQLYWDTEFTLAPYGTLLPWWAQQPNGRHLYIGQAAYRVDSNNGGWKRADQLLEQVKLNRGTSQVNGSIFFSSKSLTNNLRGVPDRLAKEMYSTVALTPPMAWKGVSLPADPIDLNARRSADGVSLDWRLLPPTSEADAPRFFIVYRFADDETIDLASPVNILARAPATLTRYVDTSARSGRNYTYIVTAVSRMRGESPGKSLVYVE